MLKHTHCSQLMDITICVSSDDVLNVTEMKKNMTFNLKCKIWEMSMRLISLLMCCATMNVLQEAHGEGGRQDREWVRLLDLFLWLHHVALQASKGDSCFFSIQSGDRWGHLKDCWASVTQCRGKLCCAMVVWCFGSILRVKIFLSDLVK